MSKRLKKPGDTPVAKCKGRSVAEVRPGRPGASQDRKKEIIKAVEVETVPVRSLRPYPGNPRTHSKKQVRQIADSILRFGLPTRC